MLVIVHLFGSINHIGGQDLSEMFQLLKGKAENCYLYVRDKPMRAYHYQRQCARFLIALIDWITKFWICVHDLTSHYSFQFDLIKQVK